MTTAVQWFVNIFTGYAVCGLIFAIAFVTVGVGKIDPVAKGSGLAFRLIIFPGVAGLWPLLLTRWLTGERHP